MHYISFPNLGIDPFRVTQNALEFGNFRITWYGVIITLGIILAVVCVLYRRKQEGISTDDILDYAIFSIFSAIIGARAYYVLTTLDTGNYKSFYDVIAIWEGGLAIYGGLIGGILAILIVSCVKKIDCRKIWIWPRRAYYWARLSAAGGISSMRRLMERSRNSIFSGMSYKHRMPQICPGLWAYSRRRLPHLFTYIPPFYMSLFGR